MSRKKRSNRPPQAAGGATGDHSEDPRTDIVETAEKKNAQFEKYYRDQSILPEDEWESFLKALREPLPTTFRVTGSRQTARLLNEMIRDTHVPHLAGIVFEDEAVEPPKQIPWYPEGLAWQFNVSKKVLRKQPEFKKFHSFLVYETEVGNISRQEAVSMLPPLFLEVEPHHRVIDMCAAPGSKTAQLLEALHANDTLTASSTPPGLLIANDSDHKRTHMLIHQAARLPSPALMVTNHDASIYPAIKVPSEVTAFAAGTKARVAAKRQHQLLFDRILCDVPCSGDGTMRKNPGIWKHWTPMDGMGLHGLQLRILQRAMRMLKKGGRIVYSTCSLNPVENEAVVAAALKSIPGFELVDMSDHLPNLIYRPGMTSWRPAVTRQIHTYATYDDYVKSLPQGKTPESKFLESHWPPSPDEVENLNLQRCMRIYPHLQDTGGFFIAVLHKIPPPTTEASQASRTTTEGKRQAEQVEGLEASDVKKPKLADGQDISSTAAEPGQQQDDEEPSVDEAATEPTSSMQVDAPSAPVVTPAQFQQQQQKKGKDKGKGGGTHFKENPYTYVSPEDPLIQTCITKLNLQSDFPASNMLVRNPEGDAVRSLYMTNDIVKQIVLHNDYARMRLMTCGTKVFAKQEGTEAKKEGVEAQFRVLSEGLPVVLPYIKPEAILEADVATLRILMESYYPLCSRFGQAFRSLIEPKDIGSYVVRFTGGQEGGPTLTQNLVLPIWKSHASITLMIDKKAKSAMSMRLFGEDITVVARDTAQKRKEENAAKAEEIAIVEADDVPADAVDSAMIVSES